MTTLREKKPLGPKPQGRNPQGETGGGNPAGLGGYVSCCLRVQVRPKAVAGYYAVSRRLYSDDSPRRAFSPATDGLRGDPEGPRHSGRTPYYVDRVLKRRVSFLSHDQIKALLAFLCQALP
jgi:hypothetical protein